MYNVMSGWPDSSIVMNMCQEGMGVKCQDFIRMCYLNASQLDLASYPISFMPHPSQTIIPSFLLSCLPASPPLPPYNISGIAPRMNQVEQLIIRALTTADNNQLRQQAESTIFSLLRDTPAAFFLTCAQIVSDQRKPDNLRQQAATVMKAVIPKRTEGNEYFWDLADRNTRKEVKDILLSNLVSPNPLVMRAGANVIAQIAAIEIARNEWLEIVNALAENSMHEDLQIRRASITTLGFICEELKHTSNTVNSNTCEQILGSLLLGLSENSELVEISLAALRESVPFLRRILENPYHCEKTFEYVLPLLSSPHTQRIYQFLFEFGRYCYHLLGNYLPAILQFSLEHIRGRSENAVLALELWDTIGSEYAKLAESQAQRAGEHRGGLRNYLEELQDVLLPEVMQAILILDKADLDLPELRNVAVKTLGTIVGCCGREVVEKVTNGVSRVLGSNNAGERQASALIFSSLCSSPDKDYIRGCFANGFPHLVRLIADPSPLVLRNTLNGFVILSETFPDVFLNYNEVYSFFLHLLGLSVNKDEDIQVLSLSVLTNMTDALRECPCPISADPDGILQQMVGIFTNNLTQNCFKESNEKIITVMMNVLMATTKKNVVVMLTTHLIGLYGDSAKATNMSDRGIVLGQIITVIHTCLLSLSKFSIQYDLKHRIYDLIDLHLRLNGIEQEGIHMISALSIAFKREFLQDQLEKYWSVVMQGLEWVDQKLVFKAALNCIADIARCEDGRAIQSKLIPVFERLVKLMHNNTLDREIKIDILNCFGDLSIGLKAYDDAFVNTLINICNECFEAVYKFSEIQQQRDYAEELKESLMEMYHCVIFAQNQSSQANRKLMDHFPYVCTFIVRSCDVRLKPTVDYLKMCLYVIFDSALFYSRSPYANEAGRIIRSPEVQNLVSIIRKFNSRKDVQDLLEFIDKK